MPSPGLYPIQPVGEPATSRKLLTYAERDVMGVEDPAAALSDYTGFNERAAWTRRVKATVDVEHDLLGVHDTPKIPRAVIFGGYRRDDNIYQCDVLSYVQDASLGPFQGPSAAVITPLGGGRIQIDLKAGYHLPGTVVFVMNLVRDQVPRRWMTSFVGASKVRIHLETMLNDHQFIVRRFEGAIPSSLSQKDGNIGLAVFC